ncbi:TPA: hypothetical protein N0F65_000326 [Lagenidium giganteum]|uniref:C2 domain-containing protein n=1 Tax=Lagenidium giganteum TaxID=4803 RepID=A0AAV2YNU2_9STRA|nr:TPA: hypothetical protein N0F65_000326 [Lagenidium giganteum]
MAKKASPAASVASPTHAVHITLLRATGLPRGDLIGLSDAYVKFCIQGHSASSSIRPNTLDPVWSPPESFDFKIGGSPEEQVLQVDVYDHDRIKRDDHLGTLKIPLAGLVCVPPKADKDVAVTQYALAMPKGVTAHHGNKSVIELKVHVTELDSTECELEMWENEVWVLGHGWCNRDGTLIHHRARWSTEDGKLSGHHFEEVAPKPPAGFEPDGWTYTVATGDENGWFYAASFAGPWHAKSGKAMVVRRRRWQNICRRPISKRNLVADVVASSTVDTTAVELVLDESFNISGKY